MHPVYAELPPEYAVGIGNVIVAHALLEWRAFTLVCDILAIDYSDGRAAFRYQSAFERFKVARELLELKGIAVDADLSTLQNDIQKICGKRDELAHGVWMQGDDGEPRLRLIKGDYETTEGFARRSALPQGGRISAGYFEKLCLIISGLMREVSAISAQVLEQRKAARM